MQSKLSATYLFADIGWCAKLSGFDGGVHLVDLNVSEAQGDDTEM